MPLGYFRPPISNTSPSRAPSKAKSQNEKQVATEIPDTVSERSAHSAGEAYRDAHNELQYAIRLLLEAASAGFIVAKTNLGTIYEEIGDMDHATKW